jgi:hypothetical protein
LEFNGKEPAMKTQAFMDRSEIEDIFRTAKRNRITHLRQETAKAGGAARWAGVGALVAAGLTFFVDHSTTARAGAGGDDGRPTFSRYY